jgi:hypothetical protein
MATTRIPASVQPVTPKAERRNGLVGVVEEIRELLVDFEPAHVRPAADALTTRPHLPISSDGAFYQNRFSQTLKS